MFNLQLLIDKIAATTNYKTGWARAQEPSLDDKTAAPRVFVGYMAVKAQPGGVLGEGETPDPYMYFAEDLSQEFVTQLICSVEEFHSAWRILYLSVSGWIPLEPEKEFTGIYHNSGGIMGLDNGRMVWQDSWRIDFPRANPFE